MIAPAVSSRPGINRRKAQTMVAWDQVSRDDVLTAIQDYDRLGSEQFFSQHGYGPSRSYELIWNDRHYPHKAILGTAYEIATGQRLAPETSRGAKLAPCESSAIWDLPCSLWSKG
jgi:hypothetical protein